MYKRFTVTVVSDLRKVISKQTPPLNKGRIGNAEKEINTAAFNRINTAADRKFFWIFGFLSHSDRILTDCPNHFPDFSLESLFFLIKNIFIMKNLTNFHETVETDVDPRLLFTIFFSNYTVNNNRICLSAHSYSFWPQQRLIQSKLLTVVKLSFDTSLLVIFFFSLLQIDSQHYVRSKIDQLGLSWDTDKK